MDLDDDLDKPSQVPSRTIKFAPKSKLKTQPKPIPEAEPSKSEPQESVQTVLKVEPSSASVPNKIEVEKQEIKPIIDVLSKTETEVCNGDVKMEIDAKEESAGSVKDGDSMDLDKEQEEEDMIVREIDVYSTPSIDPYTQLYVLQYPLRPRWRPYELDERCEEVRVQPDSTEVEIDLSIDHTKNWEPDVSSKLKMKKQEAECHRSHSLGTLLIWSYVTSCDIVNQDATNVISGILHFVTKYLFTTLSSLWSPPPATGYAVGVLIGNKLHLNPIHAVVQLRPSINYLNSGGSKVKNIKTGADFAVKVEDSTERKPLGQSKKQSKQMDSGNEHKPEVEESWIPLKYHGSKSDLSSRYLQKMVTQENSSIEFAMNPYDYMKSLCPGTSNSSTKPNGPSRRVLLSLPLEERIKKLFLEGPPVHKFAALKHLSCNDSIEDLLTVLQKHGQLVQGLWVPKTTLLFPNPKPNENSKLAARDFVLLLFSKSLVITASQLNVPLKPPLLKAFLNIFAIERPSFKDWKFKENMDGSFAELYPDIVERQKQAWEGTERNLYGSFNRAGKTMPKSATLKRKKTMTAETREALLKVLPKVLQNHKVCSFQFICQSLRDLAISQSTLPKADPRIAVVAASGADAPPEELQEVISEIATNVHGFYVLKSLPEHADHDPLRKVVIDLFLARGPNASIKKSEVQAAARHELKKEVSNNEYIKVMSELCESRGSAWLLKSGDGKP